MIPAGFTVAIGHFPAEPEARRYAALIQRPGKNGPHMASFTFAPTQAEAQRKAEDAIESWINPVKKHKQPADLDTVPVADQEEDFPV